MYVKKIINEDFNNYKVCSMFIAFPSCTWKCGKDLCQNSELACAENQLITQEEIYNQYIENPISQAIVCGGLEPFDDFNNLYWLITEFRKNGNQDLFVIYTGYEKNEITDEIFKLEPLGNIIIKFGRFIPEQESHFDEVLGVNLASSNQYAEVIS